MAVLLSLMLTATASAASLFPSRYNDEIVCQSLEMTAFSAKKSRMNGEPKFLGNLLMGTLINTELSGKDLSRKYRKELENMKKDYRYIFDIVWDTPATEKDQTILFNKLISEIKHGCYPNKSR